MKERSYQFATEANKRRNERARTSGAGTTDYDQSAWGILMRALIDGYGVDPQKFQLVYPTLAWNWPVQNLGIISAPQYDALSTIPDWSAIGKYSSTADRFHTQYGAFLNVISPDTSDPQLREQIDGDYNDLVDKSNQYNKDLSTAEDAFDSDKTKGDSDFTSWLGTLQGAAYRAQIEASGKAVAAAQSVYEATVSGSKTPNLTSALEAFSNDMFYAKLNDPNLSGMPKVPSWSTSEASNKWTDRAKTGNVPGGSISISNADSSYDYKKSWANSCAKVGNLFWSVQVKGSWERIDTFESDASLSASINFKGIELIGITTGDWYSGLKQLSNGPYKRGFSKDGGNGTAAVFGKEGFLPMVKTGMWVAYKPTFTISVSKATFSSFSEKFKAATGVRIGPFTFQADGGSEKAGWKASEAGSTFVGTSTSEVASIFGFDVQVLP